MAVCENCGKEISEGKTFCNVACEYDYNQDALDDEPLNDYQKLPKKDKPKWS